MAVLSRLDIEISANSARFQQEIQNVSTTSRRAAAQLHRDQQQQAQSRLQIERQYASEHRRIEMALTDEVERIRAARFNSADQQRYLAQARANAQQQVDLIAQQERATTGFADKAKAAYGYVAIAVGVAGLFMETHPNPAEAKSDGPNAVPLDRMKELLTQLVALDKVVRQGNMSSFTF